MTKDSKGRNPAIFFILLTLVLLAGLLTACSSPIEEPHNLMLADVVVDCYPAEVSFHNFTAPGQEDFGIFNTIVSVTAFSSYTVKDFSLSLEFDPAVIQYESIISRKAVLTSAKQRTGAVDVMGTLITPQPDVNDIFTVTWKAKATAITTGTLMVHSLTANHGQILAERQIMNIIQNS
jgi:hypothetical protein